jgi:PAS domain S-box-containing protein
VKQVAAREKVANSNADLEQQLQESRSIQAALAQATRTLRMINAGNQAMIHAGANEGKLLSDICRAAVEIGGYKFAWIGYAEDDAAKSIRPVATGGPDTDFVAEVQASWADTERGRGPTGTAIRTGKIAVVRDLATDTNIAPWRLLSKRGGYRSCASVPLKLDGKVFGALSVCSGEQNAFSEPEIELLSEFGEGLAYGIGAVRARDEKRRSEERYRRLIDTINDGVLVIDEALTVTFVNSQFAHMLGYEESDILGHRSIEFMDEVARRLVPERVEKRKAGVADRYELAWLRRDGTPVPSLVSGRPIFDREHHYRGSISVITDLTDIKKTESVRDQLARIVEGAQDGIIGKDLNGVVTSWNKGAERMYGYSAAEIVGRNIEILAPPERRHEIRDLIARVRRGEEVGHYETERFTKAGKRIDVLLSLSPFVDHNGNLNGVSSIVHDITERKQAERKAQDAALYARSLIEASLDPLVTISAEGKITDVNEATVHATGIGRHKLIGSDFADYFTAPDSARAGYRRVLRDGTVRDYPLTLLNVSGGRRDVLYNATVYHDEAGTLQGVFAAARDITERKRAGEALRNSEELFRTVCESAADCILVLDRDYNYLYANEAAIRYVDATPDMFINKNIRDALGHLPEFMHLWMQRVDRVVATGREVRAEDASIIAGKPVWSESVTSPLRNEGREVYAASIVYRDITGRKRAEEELRQHRIHLEEMVAARTADLGAANAKLDIANKELETFAYSVSHDLRAPLRAVDGFSRILIEDYVDKLDAEGQHVLNVIRESTVKMNRMIDDILAFSRASRTEMANAPVDMDAMVRAAIKDLNSAIGGRKVSFEVGELPPARGDAAMVQRVWANLLQNAVKYTGPKPEASIQIGATAVHGETVYFVRDNGVGFDMRYVDKLFGVFQRLHGAEFSGTGIGLAIVKRVVTRHGGRVWAEGKLNEGATFCFTLPNPEKKNA